jgi:hypothetical protein
MFNSEGLLPVTVFSGDDSVRIWVHERTDQALDQALRLSKRVNGNLHQLLVRQGTNFNLVLGYSSSPLSFGMALYPACKQDAYQFEDWEGNVVNVPAETDEAFAARENELINKGGGEIYCHITMFDNDSGHNMSRSAAFEWASHT